jgi:HAD superfamily hydrolase (TIGR01509 family)
LFHRILESGAGINPDLKASFAIFSKVPIRPAVPSAILFDMDGVLVRSEEVWFALLRDASSHFGGKLVTREAFAPTFGQGTAADIEMFGFNCTVPILEAYFAKHFADHAPDVWVDPTAKPLLASLQARGISRAVVTNTSATLAADILSAAGMLELFQVVSCASQVPRAKPAPDVVTAALRQLRLEGGQAWMVGDSRYDREAARAAGVEFIGLRIDGDRRIELLEELETFLR